MERIEMTKNSTGRYVKYISTECKTKKPYITYHKMSGDGFYMYPIAVKHAARPIHLDTLVIP